MEKESNNSKKNIRQLTGTVASANMKKTVVVTVDRLKMHDKYRKQYMVSRRYKAHDEKGEYKVGDKVIIRETRPLSKEKHWMVVGKVNGEKA